MLRARFLAGLSLLAAVLLAAGCMKSEEWRPTSAAYRAALPNTEAAPARDAGEAGQADRRLAEQALTGPGAAVAPPAEQALRKIIYSANVELVVENFEGVPERVAALVKQYDGYIADSSIAGASGASRRATWKLRVPVEKFESFVASAKALGELVRAGTSSADVSEEYYDVEARIRNKTKEEQRLIALLEDRPGKLEDVIAIERELSRVREEIERMQGRMRVLTDLTSLTTVTLTIAEIRNYEPPQAATLATRIRRSFTGSVESIRTFFENLLIGAASLAPWIPLWGALGLVAWRGARKLWRRLLSLPQLQQ